MTSPRAIHGFSSKKLGQKIIVIAWNFQLMFEKILIKNNF